jgi:hypothetical protein
MEMNSKELAALWWNDMQEQYAYEKKIERLQSELNVRNKLRRAMRNKGVSTY